MTPDPSLTEEYEELLAACDQALASGDPLPPDADGVGPLARDLECLRRLHRLRQVRPPVGAVSEVGRFRVRRELGRGGFGVVYLAFDPRLGRDVALKIPRPDVLASADLRERFHREARAAAGLDHPNVVPVFEAGEAGPVCYIASAYCPGPTLREWLRGRTDPVPIADAAALVAALADGVAHAHARGVIHRDLKPANVLLQPFTPGPGDDTLLPDRRAAGGFTPRITDFGLAKLADPAEAVTRTGAALGTPSYMAPEQAEGKREVGPAADVYALGAILYELLTGRPPFVGESDLDTLQQAIAQDPVPPSRLRLRLPRDLETVCLKCLEKDPRRRYPTATELAADLRRFLAGEPVMARRVSVVGRAWRRARRRPVVAGLLTAVVALAAGGAAAVIALWRQAAAALANEQAARRDETEHRERAETQLAATLIALAHRDWLADDLDQARRHLAACPPEYHDRQWRYLDRACRAERLVYRRHAGCTMVSVAFHPDGRSVASLDATGYLAVWDPADGRELFTLRGGTIGQFQAVRFRADGAELIWARSVAGKSNAGEGGRLEVCILGADRGNEVHRFSAPGTFSRVAISADGSRIAASATGAVEVFDVPTGAHLCTVRPAGVGADFSRDGRILGVPDAERRIRCVDAATGQVLHVFGRLSPYRNVVTLSPLGDRAATAAFDATRQRVPVTVWDASGGEKPLALPGHRDPVVEMIFSPDGGRLATASRDRTVVIWDMGTGKEQLTLRGHDAQLTALAFSSDGRLLATGEYEGMVRVWDVSPYDD
jgi:tRNA A-37 threonylcarbamoyl transferase component Bud32